MKFIHIHHRLGTYSSHHFNEANGFMREFARRGKEYVLLVNAHAQPEIVARLNARPVLDDPTFRVEWSFEERSRRFLDTLHRRVDRLVRRDDCVLLTVATQLEAHALMQWMHELPQRKKPWIVVLFLSDRWNRAGRDEFERQIAEFRNVKAVMASLADEDARRLILCTLTDLLADELHELLGEKPHVVPMPLPFDAIPFPQALSNPPRIAVLGGTRREKGSHRIPDIIRACRSRVNVEFIVQLTNNTLTAEEAETLGRIADEPQVTVIREAMPLAEYEATFDRADITLFPYEVIPYRKRTSGVFGEAVARGKPVVVTPGTWMAEQIESGRAAGTIAEGLEPQSIARAIARCIEQFESFQQAAQRMSVEWRKSGLSAFVDFIEAVIALRSRT